MIQAIAFYLFAGVMIASAVMVVSARNPVHSVLFLILAFFNAAALFVLLGAEFLAMILVVVSVGAVGLVLLAELVFVGMAWIDAAGSAQLRAAPTHGGVDNTRALGRLIYTHYALVFQASGLVLLVAMIGAIVLTLRQRPGVKRQDIGRQPSRTRDTGVEIVKIKPRTGV